MGKLTRREFLIILGKTFLLGLIFYLFPIKFFFSRDKFSFSLKIKPFQEKDLYNHHNLAG
ncbi:MAG: hypothetical protein DRO93_11935 [Candidatus Thorarchaeota archaeon]|nr:MAG: hypothetical protein DRO93_11935 [Candidatus Thorarchaeota archaeon]